MYPDEKADCVIIGAGPAGMSAAIEAAKHGLDCLVLDERPAPGGQIYAGAEFGPVRDRSCFGPDYSRGLNLISAFRAAPIRYNPLTTVWDVTEDGTVFVSDGAQSRRIKADRIIIAAGAMERPFPIPGWTLPGVMTVGGAQLLFKTSGVVPKGPAVLAGSGPLLLLLACQYIDAGVPIAAILDTTPHAHWFKALPHLPAGLASGSLIGKGLGLLAKIRRAGVPVVRAVTRLRAIGSDSLEAVEWETAAGGKSLPASLLLLHQGVIPNTHLARALRLDQTWDERLEAWHPVSGRFGKTKIERVAVAGDGAGISGAIAAEHSGRLAALNAAFELGRLSEAERDRLGAPLLAARRSETRARRFADILFAPPRSRARSIPDDAIICRCEEVTAGALRREVRRDVREINRAKALLRCGMGPCQGRSCEATVSAIIAEERQISPAAAGYLRIRPPIKPLPIGELIGLGDQELPAEARIPVTSANTPAGAIRAS
ncbi:FAD-dependent oxidoreductase [Rhodoligotrophos ferricapiens]|uniref:FAD-dependent oxidoreductase n=1 Tax=Rhodoligotrophos ferricapiens TaxID=3069264 RepID=UPI00315D5B67